MTAAFISSHSSSSPLLFGFPVFTASAASRFRTFSTIQTKVARNCKLKPCVQYFGMDAV